MPNDYSHITNEMMTRRSALLLWHLGVSISPFMGEQRRISMTPFWRSTNRCTGVRLVYANNARTVARLRTCTIVRVGGA